jgi:soluble lytic murein transglycosylase-like protein
VNQGALAACGAALIVGAYFCFGRRDAIASSEGAGGDGGVSVSNRFGLPDVDSSDQGGSFSDTFDSAFEAASNRTGVPFALIKAHAIRESALNDGAYRYENPRQGASYGLMQVLWVDGSDRFADWGYPDSALGMGGSFLYNPTVNAYLGAMIIQDNLKRLRLRDAVNAYNTGVKESVRRAPGNYVDDVLKNYSLIVGQTVN